MSNDYIYKVIRKFFGGEYSEDTNRAFRAWVADDKNTAEKDEALRNEWKRLRAKADASTEASFKRLLGRVQTSETRTAPPYRRLNIWHYAAVMALLVASVATTYILTRHSLTNPSSMVERYTSYGQMDSIALPDGSKVMLNSNSFILYPDNFNEGKTRTIYLIGEGNFEVAKNPDKPFIVRCGNLSVTALGTEFNVNAYPENNDIEATLLEGKVKVACGDNDYILSPGEQIVYNRLSNESRLQTVNMQDVTAWQRGEIVFRSSHINKVLHTLEHRFGVHFQYNENLFNDDAFNFSFRRDASLRQVLDIMKLVTGKFDYKIEADTCYLMGKKY